MSRTVDAVVCRSPAVKQAAAEVTACGTPLTQNMVDALEQLWLQGVDPARAASLVRDAYLWFGPGAEADAFVAAHLPID